MHHSELIDFSKHVMHNLEQLIIVNLIYNDAMNQSPANGRATYSFPEIEEQYTCLLFLMTRG